VVARPAAALQSTEGGRTVPPTAAGLSAADGGATDGSTSERGGRNTRNQCR
jgi:hypothetical protein